MTSPSRQESGPLREWAPLTALLQKLPAKFHVGLFAQDVSFTCIDAVAEFIVVGTNHGLVYWFDRITGKLETLACENSSYASITCVKVVSTVEFMIAAGNDQGIITIFQIPKKIPDSLPESLKPCKKPQVERFSIRGMHKVSVTAVEWSKNGMKLFSGDRDGFVVSTEMDFIMHLSKSTELLNEKYPVVQLSYQSGLLLISTIFRTIIVDKNQNNQVKQIGQKERKMLGKFGAVFSSNRNYGDPPIIYATRPGLRVWQSDKNGVVMKTLIFKEAVKVEQSRVELLNPVSENLKKKSKRDVPFGIIKPFSDNSLVTFNQDVIYILNPSEITIASVVTDLRKVTDVACFGDEIFVLEGDRNILRLSCYPEIDILEIVPNELVEESTPIAESSKPISWCLSDFTSKLKSSPIVPAIPFHKINSANILQATSLLPPIVIGLDTTSIVNAEEAVEVPPIVSINLDTPLITEVNTLKKQNYINSNMVTEDRKEIFKKISEQSFEEVLYTPKKDKALSHEEASTQLLQPIKANDDDVISSTNFQQSDEDCELPSLNNFIQPFGRTDRFVLSNERNLVNIEKAVEHKEKLLSNFLELDLSKYKDKTPIKNSCDFYESLCNNYSACDDIGSKYASKCENVEKLNSEEKKHCNSVLDKFNNLAIYDKYLEPKLNGQETKSFGSEDTIVAESNFNDLTKEFVNSTVCEEKSDWIMLG